MRRLFAALLSVLLALVLAPTAALAHGQADPDNVTVGPNAEFASWTGNTYVAPTAGNCPGRAMDPVSAVCDYLDATVTVDGAYWSRNSGGIEIVVSWEDENADFDLTVRDADGTEVASAAAGGAGPERVFIADPVGTYEIEVTPWLVPGPTSYDGTITFVSEEATEGGGGSDLPEDIVVNQPCIDGLAAGTFPCDGLDLAAFIPITTLGAEADGDEGSDVWGWTDPETGREYAFMGIDNGTTFVDVTEPTAPKVIGFIDNPSPLPSIWHDFKVIGNHVYGVSESEIHDLQIFDLTRLRDLDGSERVTLEPDAVLELFPGDSHNLAVTEETGRIYSVGTNICQGGPLAYDVDVDGDGPDTGGDFEDPTFLGCVAEDGYTHDAQCVVYAGPDTEHQGREICVNSNEDTLTVVDVTQVGLAGQDTVQLSRTPYENATYTHQGWFTEDQRYFLLGDELDEQQATDEDDNPIPTTTYIWDMADLDAPVLLNNFEHATASIDHNLYVKGDEVFQSNYTAGLRIQSLARIDEGLLEETDFFDVFPANDAATFDGTWSNYPYFDSGTIIVSGYEGMWVLQRSGEMAGVERLAGENRIATAVEISAATFEPGVDVAYVATGFGFADALTGGPLAAANDAPILLTATDALSPETAAELDRLAPGRIVVLGGEVAVGAAVEAALQDRTDGEVTRLDGTDRFDTARLIAEAYPDAFDQVVVATGRDFPDALAGGAYAASNGAPILLTEQDRLPAPTVTVLEDPTVDVVTVLGGEQVVGAGIEALLAQYGAVTRLSGTDRFATAASIIDAFEVRPTTVYVTTGFGFADAVAGVPAVAKDDGALVLVGRDEIPAAADAILTKLSPTRIVVLGGTEAVSEAVELQLATYLG